MLKGVQRLGIGDAKHTNWGQPDILELEGLSGDWAVFAKAIICTVDVHGVKAAVWVGNTGTDQTGPEMIKVHGCRLAPLAQITRSTAKVSPWTDCSMRTAYSSDLPALFNNW